VFITLRFTHIRICHNADCKNSHNHLLFAGIKLRCKNQNLWMWVVDGLLLMQCTSFKCCLFQCCLRIIKYS